MSEKILVKISSSIGGEGEIREGGLLNLARKFKYF
jgi:hypothetical protein